jgi:hypothetical protein
LAVAKALRLSFFGGMVPRAGRRSLQDTQAQVATNVRLTSGQLQPLRDLVEVDDPDITNLESIYKLTQDGQDYWLGWAADVDAAKGPIAGDTTNRTYFTGDGEPRVTDFDLATDDDPFPDGWYVLGVTPPITAPAVSHAGGAGAAIDRTFVYTFVTPWGEESKPSPASTVVTGKIDGTWTVASMDVAPGNTYTISAAAWSGGSLDLTVTTTFGLRAGETITLSDLAPAVLNATWTVASVPDGTSILITMADPGVITDGTGTATRVAPHNTTSMTKRIYWSETTVSGTVYQLVKDSIAVSDTTEDVAGDEVPAEELPTTTWAMPPVDLAGIMFHPSGAAVGFSKNQVCFSEPYAPYAWPPAYQFTVDYDIVGVGIFGSNVVVATKGSPYLASGIDPESVALSKVDLPWPCLAKRGVVSMGFGVMYPAPQGLVLIGVNGSELVTKELYTQEEWDDLVPSSFRAAAYSGRYVASYDPGSSTRMLLLIDRGEYASVTTANRHCDVVYGDQQTGTLYVVNTDMIHEWDSSDGSLLTYDWMSKEVVSPEMFNPGAAKVDADFELTPEESAALVAARVLAIAANQALITAGTYDVEGSMSAIGEIEVGGVSFDEAPDDDSEQLQFQLWIDNELKFNKQLTGSTAFRLPAGYKGDALAVRITGNVRVNAVVLGETMKSLKTA